MPTQKCISTWKLFLAVCATLFLAYTLQNSGASFLESAHALDFDNPNGICSNHGEGILNFLAKLACYALYVVNVILRIPIVLTFGPIGLLVWMGALLSKITIFLLYEIIMTIATVVIFFAIFLLESTLSPEPGSIVDVMLYQPEMQNIIRETLWEPVRDIVNVGFALILIFGAITTILKANKEWLSTHAPKLLLMIILVNFSWFFSRVILDIGNVAAKTSFSLATPNCVGCTEIKRIGLAGGIGLTPGYSCPLVLICYNEGPPTEDPVDKMTAGLFDGFIRILRVQGDTLTDRITRLLSLTPLLTFFGNMFTVPWEDIPSTIITLFVAIYGSVLSEAVRAFVLLIAAFFFLGALSILFVIFLLRIPIIWLTQGFMPLAALLPVWPEVLPGKAEIKKHIWDKFLIAAFLPAIAGLPMAAGFAILQTAKNFGTGSEAMNVIAARMPGVTALFFGNIADDFVQLLYIILGIIILWIGVIAALKANEIVPGLQGKIVDYLGGATKFGARALGEFTAKRMPLLPSGKAMARMEEFIGKKTGFGLTDVSKFGAKLTGIPQGANLVKRKLAGLAPGTEPKPGTGKGPTPPPDSGPMLIGPDGKRIPSPPPIPKKALTPEKRKELVGRKIEVDGARATVDKVSDNGTTVSLTGTDGTKYEAPYEKLAGARVLKEKDAKTTPTEGAKAGEPIVAGKIAIEKPGAAGKGIGEEAVGEEAEPTWGQAWEGLKNTGIGRTVGKIVGGTRKSIFGQLIGETFRDKSQDGGLTLGHVMTGLQTAGKELGTMARAGNAPLTQSASEALKDARRQQNIPKEDVGKFHSAAQTDTTFDRHLNDFLANDTNMEHNLGQILLTLRAMGHAKGSSLSVSEGNLPSLLEELFKKKLETGGRGFTGPGMGGISTGNDMFRKVLVQLEKVEAERRKRSTPPPAAPPPTAP